MKKGDSSQAEQPVELPQRLCSEIQLFDLCELEQCRYREGRFCTDTEMLARFEAVAEPEDRPVRSIDDDGDDDPDMDGFSENDEDDEREYSVFDDEDRDEPRDDDW